jgi:hypothetical protein
MVPLTLFFPILFEYVELCTMHVIPMYPVFFFFLVCMFLTGFPSKSILFSFLAGNFTATCGKISVQTSGICHFYDFD